MGPIKEIRDKGNSPCEDVDKDVKEADVPVAVERVVEGRNGRKGHIDAYPSEV